MTIRVLLYLDTNVPINVAPRKHTRYTRDIRRFWDKMRRSRAYEPMVSWYVIDELKKHADAKTVNRALALLKGVRVLAKHPLCDPIAQRIREKLRLGPEYHYDVAHIVMASLHNAVYLVTSDKEMLGKFGRDVLNQLVRRGHPMLQIVLPLDMRTQINPRRHEPETEGVIAVRKIRRRIARIAGGKYATVGTLAYAMEHGTLEGYHGKRPGKKRSV